MEVLVFWLKNAFAIGHLPTNKAGLGSMDTQNENRQLGERVAIVGCPNKENILTDSAT